MKAGASEELRVVLHHAIYGATQMGRGAGVTPMHHAPGVAVWLKWPAVPIALYSLHIGGLRLGALLQFAPPITLREREVHVRRPSQGRPSQSVD